jgi:hypothetical protein
MLPRYTQEVHILSDIIGFAFGFNPQNWAMFQRPMPEL